MTTETTKRGAVRHRTRRETAEFHLIFAATFVFFLAAAVLSSILRLAGLTGQSADTHGQSILKQAWSAADVTTSYAFMG